MILMIKVPLAVGANGFMGLRKCSEKEEILAVLIYRA